MTGKFIDLAQLLLRKNKRFEPNIIFKKGAIILRQQTFGSKNKYLELRNLGRGRILSKKNYVFSSHPKNVRTGMLG